MKSKAARLVLCIALGILLVIMVFPMVTTLMGSFLPDWEVSGYKGAADTSLKLIPSQVTLEQYDSALIQNHEYWDYFWNSILLTLPIVLGQVLVSAFAAYAFTVMKYRWKEMLFFLYIVVMLLPFQVTLVPAYLTADALGILNNRLSVILPGVFSTFGVFLLRQHMNEIPKSYLEAARMDGAGHWKIFRHVVVPACKTGIVALVILSFIDNWNMVEQPLIFLNDTSKWPLSIYFYDINQTITVAFAASVVYMIPILLVFANGEKQLMEGIRLSGIK